MENSALPGIKLYIKRVLTRIKSKKKPVEAASRPHDNYAAKLKYKSVFFSN